MKGLPSTLAGWVTFYLFLIAVVVVVAWVSTGVDLPQAVSSILSMIAGGFLTLLTGKAIEQLAGTKTTIDSTTTVETPPKGE
mgnify:CR=1 FL=1